MSRELSILVTARNLSQRVLGQVRGDINGVEGAAKRAGTNVGRNIGIATAAVGAGIAVQVRAGVDSLVELERVENLTAAALASTGNKAKQSLAGIRARAEAMEHLTGVDDKAIQNAENLLLTFAQIGEKAFEPTLESAINLNAALGGGDESLQGVLLQVAKAVNDPIRGMTALRRSGVSFTDAQIKQVKALVEANDLMGAQAIVLGELETQFGGAAEAANSPGALRAQRRWADGVEDIQKSLATGFLPLIERVSGKMSELVADPAFLAGVQGFGEAMAGAFDEAIDFAEGVDWGAIGSALTAAGTGARMAMDAFLGAPPWLQTAILTGWGLNKLTGGGLGSIVGALGSGLIKGVLGMNAGVVNINAATVNGGVGGVPTAGGKGGGLFGNAWKLLPPLAAAALAAEFSDEIVGFGVGLRADLAKNLDIDLPTFGPDDLDWPFGNRNTPTILPGFLDFGPNGFLGGTPSVAPRATPKTTGSRSGGALDLAAQTRTYQAEDRRPVTAMLPNTAMAPVTSGLASVVQVQRESRDADRATLQAARNWEGVARSQVGYLSSIASKNFSPTVKVNTIVNSFVSVHEWQRTVRSSQRAYSDLSGGT